MMEGELTPESFGRRVLGPIVAEFCLRLWSLGSMLERGDDAALLFCARGGLRMQLAYERFLAASALPSPVHVAPLMVSRVVAIRPALVRTLTEKPDSLLPAAAATLSYEFAGATVSEVASAMAGIGPLRTGEWDVPFTPGGLVALFRHPDGQRVVGALGRQVALFTRHLDGALGGRRRAVLVDTGLRGTTVELLAEGVPAVDFSSVLIARSNYRDGFAPRHHAKTCGLTVESDGYSPLRRRTAVLRYWHFVEWLFEPELPSVRTFEEFRGEPRSNLEVDGWQQRVQPIPGSAFAGVLQYLEALPAGPAERVLVDADRAWSEFRWAVIWPHRGHSLALGVGARSHDFGTDLTWSARPWRGPVAALRGSSMWREGEIAASGSPLRGPLLAAIEVAYGARRLKRAVTRSTRSSSNEPLTPRWSWGGRHGRPIT